MSPLRGLRPLLPALVMLAVLLLAPSAAFAQGAAPAAAPAVTGAAPAPPAPPASPVPAIRNKLSAADLPSAESILEVYRAKNGEDGAHLVGLSWLARGALMLGDVEKARRYTAQVRAACAERRDRGVELEKDSDLALALGAAIEVEAQWLEKDKGAAKAAEFVRRELAGIPGPVSLVSRLNKRLNLLAMSGTAAPELEVEDYVGEKPPTLASLAGSPVMLFLFNESCGDCKAEAATLARLKARHAADGLKLLAVTRHFEDPVEPVAGKARIDSVWKAVYADLGPVPVVISTAAMKRYGVSSTPTFVFIDRKGEVSSYVVTRLTEADFETELARILR
jgi:thiol-disulfide isomerase/thioredoxin